MRRNRTSSRTFPQPAEADYKSKGGHFGPHNLHENRPGSFVSSQMIFATYQNAGIRVFDIRKCPDTFRARRLGPAAATSPDGSSPEPRARDSIG